MPDHAYKILRTTLMLSALALPLTACDTNTLLYGQGGSIAHQVVYGDPTNVKTKSYAAADYLDQGLRPMASMRDLIRVEPLFTPPNKYSLKINNLGTAVPYQVGERLAQLGYNIDLSPVSDIPTSGHRNPDTNRPRYILGGTFYPQARFFDLYREVQINLSIVDTNTNRIISSFAYMLPNNAKINDMSTKNLPQTQEEANERNKQLSPLGGVIKFLEENVDSSQETPPTPEPTGNTRSHNGTSNDISDIFSDYTNRITPSPASERAPLND